VKEWRRKFELIYDKYGGSVEKELKLSKNLVKKYGDAVKLVIATDDECGETTNTPRGTYYSEPQRKSDVHSDDYYELSSDQINSGIIDFTHECFDPLAVLHSQLSDILNTNSFVKDSPLLDNIDKFRFLLPNCDPLRKEIIANAKNQSTLKPKTGDQTNATDKMRNKIPVFTAMAANFEKSGPLSLLHSIHVKRQRVKVTIRYVDCIRGTLTGYLIAFDKHMNMLLRDVDEIYTSRITKISGTEGMTKEELELERRRCIEKSMTNDDINSKCSLNPRIKVGKRHMPQILVRGDNVVSLWRADSEKPNNLLTDGS
jgi:small nuclear ribonucleoprotein (snRNP)-like protein